MSTNENGSHVPGWAGMSLKVIAYVIGIIFALGGIIEHARSMLESSALDAHSCIQKIDALQNRLDFLERTIDRNTTAVIKNVPAGKTP